MCVNIDVQKAMSCGGVGCVVAEQGVAQAAQSDAAHSVRLRRHSKCRLVTHEQMVEAGGGRQVSSGEDRHGGEGRQPWGRGGGAVLGEMRRGGGAEMGREPEQKCEGAAGHVEVGERCEGRNGRFGRELCVVDAECIAQRVPQNHKRLVKIVGIA